MNKQLHRHDPVISVRERQEFLRCSSP